MSINVTVNGNHLNIHRGRMVLSDLDQIKKNERDRRRRLRLEQVRQQSKEISDRLLERTKNIAREELKKLENNARSSLRQIYDGKIMEVQQKYQEDMADIGQAHTCASLEPDHDTLVEEQERRNKLAALKRGQEATKQIKSMQQKETQQQQHEERLRQVREVENLRSTMIANLPKQTVPEEDTICITIQNEMDDENKQQKIAKKRTRKLSSKRSIGKVTKTYTKVVGSDSKTRLHVPIGKSKQKTSEINLEPEMSVLQQQSVSNSITEPLGKQIERGTEPEHNDHGPRKEVPTKVDKSQRYNPEDYVQTTSDSNNSDSSSSFSDDSSYFSDSGEQYINREVKPTKYVKCPAFDKVQLYDHNKRQKNEYDQPVGAVEKISTWNEPSAIDLAQEIERTQSAELHLTENRKYNAQKRGEDAALREKVRRDYQTLMKNLDQLASEERKLKASQVERYPKDVYLQEERRKLLRDQHKQKLNHALETLLNDESSEQYTRCPVERQITLAPLENNKDADAHVVWEQSRCSGQRAETSKTPQNQTKVVESETSREEQILEMLKKVEKQKRLLLQEFGADLPNNIFNASIKSLFERDKSVQTQTETDPQDADVQKPLSPEIKVISTSCDEKSKKDKTEKMLTDSTVKKVEIAVQTTTEDKDGITQDKSTQVELMQEKTDESTSVSNEVHRASNHYPLEPEIVVIQPDVDSSESTSSEIVNAITEPDKQTAKVVTPKKKKSKEKPLRQTPSKSFHKSFATRTSKTMSSPKRFPKSLTKSQYSSSKKCTSSEDVSDKKIKMYIDKNGFNITMKPPQVAEVLVDVSTQSAQVYSTGTQKQTTSKQQWIQSKSKRIKIKDISDTSTSFASPPPIKPKDILEALNNNISILEMLDSSANESMRYLKRDVSPVSTPETPSPRTMMMPSNIPRPERIRKFLRYSSTDSQTNDYNTLSSTKNDYSTSTDSSEYQPQPDERLSTESVKKSPVSLEFCLCHNPDCRQAHARFEEIRNYALKNCPQILQKYEDLQNTCAERIISLTNLIEKVRDEQKGVEFSMVDPGDETSLMQLPPPRIMTNDLQSIRRLVENIEAIHNQLAKTLIDSQKIIEGKTAFTKEDQDQIKETEKITSIDDGVAKITLDPVEEKTQVEKMKAKPKIISDEIVNIQVNKYKTRKSPQIVTSTPERDAWLSQKHIEEKLIEQLSKEILEQSKGLNNNNLITSNEMYSTVNHSIQTSTDNDDVKTDISGTQTNYTSVRRHFNKELKRTKDFIPLLDDIPKVSKTIDNSTHANGRSKPPVSLLSGPYRVEIESPGHELSTIIEFDTPDTVNKSQNNIRSPLETRKLAETQITKSTGVVKPSEHIIASLNLSDLRPEKLCNSSTKKLPSTVPVQKLKETAIFPDLQNMFKNVGSRETTIWDKDVKKEGIVEREMSHQRMQCDVVHQGVSRMEEGQPFGSTSSDPNKESKDNKDKITSTSSNSFSELSGVSQIASTPSSTILKYASSPEEMEIALKKLGLGWAITTLKKTREASALSSSSNSDVTPMNTAKRISPVKKQFDSNYGLLDFSDVSSISIKEASKSTEQAVLLKGRTSTPKLQNSNSNSVEISTSNTNNSDNFREPDNALIIPNISLTKTKSNVKNLENL